MKFWICLIMGGGLLLFLAGPAPAQRAGFELHGLYAFSFDGQAEGGGKDNLSDTGGAGASFVFPLGPYVKFDVGADWLQTENRDLDNSEIRLIPVVGALRAGIPLQGFYLYGGAGAGYSINHLELRGDARHLFPEQGRYNPELDNELIYFVLAGGEAALSDSVSLRGEFRYNWHRPDLKWEDWTGAEEKTRINLDHMQVRLGAVLYF